MIFFQQTRMQAINESSYLIGMMDKVERGVAVAADIGPAEDTLPSCVCSCEMTKNVSFVFLPLKTSQTHIALLPLSVCNTGALSQVNNLVGNSPVRVYSLVYDLLSSRIYLYHASTPSNNNTTDIPSTYYNSSS